MAGCTLYDSRIFWPVRFVIVVWLVGWLAHLSMAQLFAPPSLERKLERGPKIYIYIKFKDTPMIKYSAWGYVEATHYMEALQLKVIMTFFNKP